jgi:hypothetical protein
MLQIMLDIPQYGPWLLTHRETATAGSSSIGIC